MIITSDKQRRELLAEFSDKDLEIEVATRRQSRMAWAEGRDRIVVNLGAQGYGPTALCMADTEKLHHAMWLAIVDAKEGRL